MTLGIELEREDDGRWLAEVPALSGVMCYGTTRDEAVARVQALALHDRGLSLQPQPCLADDRS